MACFIFDGVDYARTLDVVSVDMPALPPTTPDLRYAAGRDGAVLAGNPCGPMTVKITARLAADSIDERDIQREWAMVAARMRTKEPKPLYLTEDRYRLAVLSNDTQLEFSTYSATAELTFLCPDPIAYGAERTFTVPSGGAVSFIVGGSYRAAPRIEADAVRDASSQVWGVRLDEGDYIYVETGGPSARHVVLDCAKRTCVVNGTASLPTLESDWIELEPLDEDGNPIVHVLRMDEGTGEATVTLTERWR